MNSNLHNKSQAQESKG